MFNFSKKISICAYCQNRLADTDKFCTYCGRERKEKKVNPNNFLAMCIYGPPMHAKHVCSKCGFTITISGVGSYSPRYCANCGIQCDFYDLSEIKQKPVYVVIPTEDINKISDNNDDFREDINITKPAERIYGPPERKYVCQTCGQVFFENYAENDKNGICPNCDTDCNKQNIGGN